MLMEQITQTPNQPPGWIELEFEQQKDIRITKHCMHAQHTHHFFGIERTAVK